MFKRKMNKKGFTLIELIVVIAILAILAAIAVPRMIGFQDRAREQADKQVAVQVKDALSLLYANGEIVIPAAGADFTVDGAAGVASVASFTDGELLTSTNANFTSVTIAGIIDDLITDINLQSTKTIHVTMTTQGAVSAVLQ